MFPHFMGHRRSSLQDRVEKRVPESTNLHVFLSSRFVAISLGRSELDAARAYNKAARSLHGAAAKLNLLPDETPATASTLISAPEEPVETAAAEKESPRSPSSAAPAARAPEAAESLQAGSNGDTPLDKAVDDHRKEEGGGGAGAAADLYYPAELDFRDLEEIPKSTGPPLWDDTDTKLESTWAAMGEPGTGGGGAAIANVDGKGRSAGSATTAQTERETVLVEDAGRLEQGVAGGEEGGVLPLGKSGRRLRDGPPPKDESVSAHAPPPNTAAAPTTAKKASHAAVVAGMASVGGEVEAVSGGRRQRRLSSTLASSQADATGTAMAAAPPRPPTTTAATAAPVTAVPAPAVVSDPSGLDPPLPPMPSPPPLVEAEQARSETVVGAVAAADADTVAVPSKEKLLSTEEPLSAKSVERVAASAASDGGGSGESTRQGDGVLGSAGGDGGGGENWGGKGAWPGGVGTEWERDEMGDELYEERLTSVVDVRCGAVVSVFVVVPWVLPQFVDVVRAKDSPGPWANFPSPVTLLARKQINIKNKSKKFLGWDATATPPNAKQDGDILCSNFSCECWGAGDC